MVKNWSFKLDANNIVYKTIFYITNLLKIFYFLSHFHILLSNIAAVLDILCWRKGALKNWSPAAKLAKYCFVIFEFARTCSRGVRTMRRRWLCLQNAVLLLDKHSTPSWPPALCIFLMPSAWVFLSVRALSLHSLGLFIWRLLALKCAAACGRLRSMSLMLMSLQGKVLRKKNETKNATQFPLQNCKPCLLQKLL